MRTGMMHRRCWSMAAHVIPVTAVSFWCTGRLLWITDKYSVNVLFGDQWLYDVPLLFNRQSAWVIFRWQSHPWRQGLGGLLTTWLGSLSHWNSRVESFTAGALIIASCFLAVFLKFRISGKVTVWDSVIPLFLLTPVQYDTIVGSTSLSHGPLPLLFTVLFSLAWTINDLRLRYAILIPLTFVATHTGFGLFIGFLCPFVIILDWWIQRKSLCLFEKRTTAIAVGLALLSLAAFLVGYQPNDGVCPPFGPHPPLHYFLFIAFMFANFAGWKAPLALVPSILSGALILTFIVGVLLFGLRRRAVIPAFLISYSLLFGIGAARGRMCLGLGAAIGSRYMIYLAPAFLGAYILVSDGVSIRDPLARLSIRLALAFIALLSSCSIQPADRLDMSAIRQHKMQWKACYLAEHNLLDCNRKTNATPYTYPDTIQAQIDFLQSHRLNLFATQ